MIIQKFGGTSVGSPSALRQVKDIVEETLRRNDAKEPVIVVVSALSGVTDLLLRAGREALSPGGDYEDIISEIRRRHLEIIFELLPRDRRAEAETELASRLKGLEEILRGVRLLGELSERTENLIVSHGERMSAPLVAILLDAELKYSPDFIKTCRAGGKTVLAQEETSRLVKEEFSGVSGRRAIVVPGFIASDAVTGVVTNLGRGGSDYTASILAAELNAAELEIWTDVDGFLTADPRVVDNAYVIERMTYLEAMELCNFGAKVIYPPTIHPAFHRNIPLRVKNTFNPQAPGTLITRTAPLSPEKPIRGISWIKDTSLVTVEGLGMVGIVGINYRIFGALTKGGISVFLVSQASSENNTSLAVSSGDAARATEILRNEFAAELRSGELSGITERDDLATVAVVGENMKGHAGIAGKLFGTLGRGGVNVIAVAQGSAQLNISFVISKKDLGKTLRLIHDSLFLSEIRQLNLFVAGMGNVGGRLLAQIAGQQETLLSQKKLKINLLGVANSRKGLVKSSGICLADYRKELEEEGEPMTPREFAARAVVANVHNAVMVDCTASEEVAGEYSTLLGHNVSVVAANKIAASGPYDKYLALRTEAARQGVSFLFETNVGAGLPVISTINNMVNSGDHILEIEAVVSGTLNFIFDKLSPEIPFSKAVAMAREQGYSEPDPRIDLSGKDVARKIVILAREAGYSPEVADVELKPLLPPEFFEGSVDDFFARLPELDPYFEQLRRDAAENGKKLRFVASLESDGKVKAALMEIDSAHPFYWLESSNNIIALRTSRYNDYPVVIKGYGAGAEVTAAGVFADIISIANIR